MNDLYKLLSISSSSLSNHKPEISEKMRELAGSLADDLVIMLCQRNGFYAFERSLHVFPTHSSYNEIGLDDWNDDSLWRSRYNHLSYQCLFFGQDIFGHQFCIKQDRIFIFDPETGSLEHISDDFEGWARVIVSNYNSITGYSIAHEWQKENGPIPSKKRLIPKIPFVFGGEFSIENLYLGDAVEGMRSRANIAKQIIDLPDGTQVKFHVTE